MLKYNTIVIGAGQAGLAAGYFLKKSNEDFIILDAGNKIGDSWQLRWDSLRLFTPARHDSLPGYTFPASPEAFPTKEEMAKYLISYAKKFSIPVQLNTKVNELRTTSDGYEIITSSGKLFANNVIVTTGTNPKPYIPEFATKLDKNIVQIHSSEYKNPDLFAASNTLVVGAGTSGAEIAIELSKSRPTMLAGKPTPHIPDFIFRYIGEPYWWFAHNILTLGTPIGRKVQLKIRSSGAPLISISLKDIKEAHIEQLPRITDVQNGLPVSEDGRVLSVNSIIWATGYKPDFSWIKFDAVDSSGWPQTTRGISQNHKGLYFVGMLFQFGLTSGLVGGVGRDASFVVEHLKKIKKAA